MESSTAGIKFRRLGGFRAGPIFLIHEKGSMIMVNQNCYALGTAPSVIRKLFAYGLEQAKIVGADKVYDYSLGNPSIPAPAKVNQSIHDIVSGVDSVKLHGYSMANGIEGARSAVAADLSARFGLDVKSGELFLTCGAAPALISIIKALAVDGNSEIMAVAPFFPEYRPFVESNGAKFVMVPADTETFQIRMDAVEKLLSERTQAIIINSPNNPSGVVYTEETLKELGVLLERKSAQYGHPVYIIADEPYRELVYGGVKVPFIPCIYKNTIVCYSYSKSLSLPGERIGYVYVPGFADDSAAVFAAVAGAARVMGHVCPPTLMQMVIERCAGERPDLAAYEENRNLLYGALIEMGYQCAKPDGAFYLFVKAPNGDANAFSEKARVEHNLLVVPADGFGCPGYFRLSYCVAHDMIKRSLPAFKAMIESCR
jgi:aspartate aminotransferase